MDDKSKLKNALSCLGYNPNGIKPKGSTGTPSIAHHYINYRNEFKNYRALVAYLDILTPSQVVKYVEDRLI